MGLDPGQLHLTVLDPSFEAARARTYPGMAYFAGSGPNIKTCRQCVFWTNCGADPGYYARKGMYGGTIKPRACAKHKEMMGGQMGNPVPHDAHACKYFEETQAVPPLVAKAG